MTECDVKLISDNLNRNCGINEIQQKQCKILDLNHLCVVACRNVIQKKFKTNKTGVFNEKQKYEQTTIFKMITNSRLNIHSKIYKI